MMRITANKRAPSARGIFSPLRHAVFRRIWTASLLSNLGILVLGVGAAWKMTQISSSADMVALVQTSLMLPVALVSTPAGAIADMFDRRIVGLVALSIALAGSISLSVLAWLGVVTPALLLVSCFIIGSGMALFGPAWQASVSPGRVGSDDGIERGKRRAGEKQRLGLGMIAKTTRWAAPRRGARRFEGGELGANHRWNRTRRRRLWPPDGGKPPHLSTEFDVR